MSSSKMSATDFFTAVDAKIKEMAAKGLSKPLPTGWSKSGPPPGVDGNVMYHGPNGECSSAPPGSWPFRL